MRFNPFSRPTPKPPVLLAITPPRTGERTLLGVENLLQSIAIPEPFSLELTGDGDGVTVLVRCRDGEVVREQITAHYPQARIEEIPDDEDPLRLAEGEQAWGLTLTSTGPDYVPLRTFRDDDLLDPGSDPLIALLGALSAPKEGERVVTRLLLRALGPDWSQPHQELAFGQTATQRPPPPSASSAQGATGGMDPLALAVLAVVGLVAFKGWDWVQSGEPLKAALLGVGALGVSIAGLWLWQRWKGGRDRVYDPALIKEKVSRAAFAAELQVTAILPREGTKERARDLLGRVIAAYHHYDHPVGARFKDGRIRPVLPEASIEPSPPGFFGKRSALGVREVAALWHPPGARDETPLVGRSGAKVLHPDAKSAGSGAPVGETVSGASRTVHFPDDLLRRHHLYVARTRMGKSTLMRHLVAHKLREKAAGRDGDAIVVIDPHADLVAGILEDVPASLIDRVKLVDLAAGGGFPGINLLDTRIFSDRDRTADSVVRVARGLWEQWGPRMQSILEQTVKTLHEANTAADPEDQYTILDGLRLLSDEGFRANVLACVDDPYLLDWWARDFGGWRREYRAEALAPVQTRLSYYASSKRARAILGQSRSTIDLRRVILDGGVLLVSTAQGTAGRDVAALVGASLLNLVDSVIREQERLPLEAAARRARRRGRDAVHARRGLRVDALGAGQVRRLLRARHPEPGQAGRPLPHHAGHRPRQHRLPGRLPGSGQRRPQARLGAGARARDGGGHHLPARPPLLRARHRRHGAHPSLLDARGEAEGGRPGGGREHPRRRRCLHDLRDGDRRKGGAGAGAGQGVPRRAAGAGRGGCRRCLAGRDHPPPGERQGPTRTEGARRHHRGGGG